MSNIEKAVQLWEELQNYNNKELDSIDLEVTNKITSELNGIFENFSEEEESEFTNSI